MRRSRPVLRPRSAVWPPGRSRWSRSGNSHGRCCGSPSSMEPFAFHGTARTIVQGLRVTVTDGRITEIEVIGDPERLAGLDLSIVD